MNSQRGSTALFFALALGLVATIGGLYFAYSGGGSESVVIDPTAAFDSLKSRVDSALNQPAVVNATVSRNTNAFSCLYSTEANCNNQGGTFQLYEGVEANSPPLSQMTKDVGLTLKGEGCRGFPSIECPLRVEASWVPVCRQGGPCEGTRSAKIKVRVMLNAAQVDPQEWSREEVFTPEIRVSQAVTCERGGGVWALTECLTLDQASQRQIASGSSPAPSPTSTVEEVPPAYICPAQIAIQGEYYDLENIAPSRAQVRVPAMNGCPAEDLFVFQCQPRQPDDREGQWIQVEAQMASTCDANGVPMVNPDGTYVQ